LKCPECNGMISIKKMPYRYRNQIDIGEFEAEVCEKCGTVYFTQESFKEIEFRAKQLRIWGREALTVERRTNITNVKNMPIVDYKTIFGKISFKSYIDDMSSSVI